jgi:hypothetical protein
MNPVKGYYSLIQYCPDLSRLEAANVGVLLFCPEPHFLRARTATSNQRIRRFFGSADHDWEQINALKTAIEDRLEIEGERFKTLPDLEHFIATRANEIQLTPPRPVKVFNPEQDLELLFQRLVGRGPTQHKVAEPVRQALEERLGREGVLPFVRPNVTVRVRAMHRPLTVPFGYQNGRFNLVQPAAFQQLPHAAAVNRACRRAVEGRSLFEHPDEQLGQLQLVVVGQFAPSQQETQSVVRDILNENQVRLFTLADLSLLIEDIRHQKTAHDQPEEMAHPQ